MGVSPEQALLRSQGSTPSYGHTPSPGLACPLPAACVPPSSSRDCDLQFVIPRPRRVCVTHSTSSGMLMQRMWDRKFQVASLFLCRKNPTVLTQAVWVF